MFFACLTFVCTAGAWVASPVCAQTPAQTPDNGGAALVLAARGYDRANQLDSARGGYEAAALVLDLQGAVTTEMIATVTAT